jgi:hypothetical protein
MCFADIAQPFIRLGIPVFPLAPGGKCPPRGLAFLQEATTDPAKVGEWNRENPGYNVALLANGEFCFLEFDVRGGMKAAAAEMGQEAPRTRTQRSGRGFGHYIFRHTDRSRRLGNRSASLPDGKEWFSFRAHNKYLVGAGSLHPSGSYYKTVADIEPVPVPGWVCDWIERHSQPPKPDRCEGAHPVSEDFDFDGFCEHYGITISHVRDGVWHVVEECPGVGYRHEQSTLTAFYWDGESLGWSCFAQECPTHGMAIGQLVGFLSAEHGRYPGVIWDQEGDEELLAKLGVEVVGGSAPEGKAAGSEHDNGTTPVLRDEVPEALLGEGGDELPQAEIPKPAAGEDDPDPEMPVPGEPKAEEPEEGQGEEVESSEAGPEPGRATGEAINYSELATEDAGTKGQRSLLVYSLADVEMRRLEWLWPDRVPKGKSTLFVGLQDNGKSLVSLDLMARITTGRDFPEAKNTMGGPRRVMFATTEDDMRDTVKPRFIAAGGNPGMVVVVHGTKRTKENKAGRKVSKKEKVDLLHDANMLYRALKANPDIALLVLDPLSAFFGDRDMAKEKEIRPVMDQIAEVCRRTNLAVVGLLHLNKNNDQKAIQRVSGAAAVSGSSRSVWMFSRDPEDKSLYHMTNVKGNLAKKKTGLDYTIEDREVMIGGEPSSVPCIQWGKETDQDAEDMLAAQRETAREGGGKTKEAIRFLKASLPGYARDLYRGALDEHRISDSLLRKAAYHLGVTIIKDPPGKPRGSWWQMPPAGEKTLDDFPPQEAV